eukprot:9671572-Karenia_brevis.AAC.1
MRTHFQKLGDRLNKEGFTIRRAAWKRSGKFACRHGVLFSCAPQNGTCPCMSGVSDDPGWDDALWMPALDPQLKSI